jgi:hypothetical protein
MNRDCLLSFRAGDGQVWTFGLSFLCHPELTMRATTPCEAEEARRILFSLACMVIATNARLAAGEAIDLGHRAYRLRTAGHGQLAVVPALVVGHGRCRDRHGHLARSARQA